jgi:hypothetical protein
MTPLYAFFTQSASNVQTCLSIYADARKSFWSRGTDERKIFCVIVWHCVNYGLELPISDAVHAVSGIK